MQAPQRLIQEWPRDSRGLYIQPPLEVMNDPKFHTLEQHNRDRAAAKADYADMVTGNPHTVDPKKTYRCIDCNQANGTKCLLMKMNLLPGGKIDLNAGSCGKWEIICVGDAEVRFHRYSPIRLGYAEAVGKRFGCEVCPLKEKARVKDSLGREYWCGQHRCRVFGGSCCNDNTTPERKIKYPAAAYG